LKKNLSANIEPSTNQDLNQSPKFNFYCAANMKYLQICLKTPVDSLIKKLTRTLMGPGATNVARMRLVVAQVHALNQKILILADSG